MVIIMEKGQGKIQTGATARRLRKLGRFFAVGTLLSAAIFLPCVFVGGAVCAMVAVLCAAAGLACLFFAAYFFRILRKLKKDAGRYAFTVTESASFECFGPFLAMNVTFRDEGGVLREGRTRFLFGARDAEAWQNVPLEIGYLEKDERIVLIGAAPKGKNLKKREKE